MYFSEWFYLVCVIVFSANDALALDHKAHQLRLDILKEYNKSVPLDLDPGSRSVFARLHLSRIVDLDIKTGTLTTEAIVFKQWRDPRLSWIHDKDNKDVRYISIPQDELWIPQLDLLNSAKKGLETKLSAIVVPDGTLYLGVYTKIYSACKSRMRFFPNDIHTCQIIYGSWLSVDNTASDSFDILSNNRDVFYYFATNNITKSKWNLISKDHHFENLVVLNDKKTIGQVFTMVIQRDARVYATAFWITLISCFLLGIITFTPASPLYSAMDRKKQITFRMSLTGTGLIISTLIGQFHRVVLPVDGNETPVIVYYFETASVFMMLTLVAAVVTHNLSNKVSAPSTRLVMLIQAASGLSFKKLVNLQDEESDLVEQFTEVDPCESNKEWPQIACTLDLLVFFLQLLVFLVIMLSAISQFCF